MRPTLFLFSLLPTIWGANPIPRRDLNLREHRDYDAYDYYAVHLSSDSDPQQLANSLNIEYDGKWPVLDDHHIFRSQKSSNDIIHEFKTRRKLKRDAAPHPIDAVLFNQKQIPRQRLFKRGLLPRSPEKTAAEVQKYRSDISKSLGIQDPIFNDQWHLINVNNPGFDMNVSGVWTQGITGKNVSVCIIDDGVDPDSDDLKDNYFAEGSWDFNDKNPIPKPRLWDDTHGTRCAGEVAAQKNNVCGVGVAWDAKVSGVRILSAPITDIDEAEAVGFKYDVNHIYSCSWGPPDDGMTMDAPGVLIKQAMQKAIQKGRNNLGSVYVFAVGNGANHHDNCNFDGYTNSIFSVSIGAVDRYRLHPYYSEACSAQLAVTYSSGSGESIHTTDVGKNKCTGSHGGTSAAGPLVSGLYALLLSARPDLSWRDVQWITALTSIPFFNEEAEEKWQKTALGRKFSHQFGFGIVDGWAMIELAKTWTPVKKQAWYTTPWIHVRHDIPEGDVGIVTSVVITEAQVKAANFARVEQVTVTMNIEHHRRGDLSVDLISPFGVVSHLSVARFKDEFDGGYNDWTFMSVVHFGETGIGEWKVVVKDTEVNQKTGKLIDFRIKIYGECIDESIQKELPLPVQGEDDDHDREIGIVSSTSIGMMPKPTASLVSTSLPTRPSILKPTGTDSNSTPSNTPTSSADDAQNSDVGNSFLPSPFPTFGLSRSTQAWMYGAVVLIIIFCIALVAYIWIQSRKRNSKSTDNYEFAVLEDQETDAMLENPGTRRQRGGELYDAFAGESDEELFSDDNTERPGYRDSTDSKVQT